MGALGAGQRRAALPGPFTLGWEILGPCGLLSVIEQGIHEGSEGQGEKQTELI